MTGGPGGIEPGIATDPPFQGLRRNAPALVIGFILVVAIGFFLPDLTPPPSQPSPVELLRGRILELLPPSDDPTVPDVRILALDGAEKGQTLDAHLQGPSGGNDLPRYQVGDEVVVNVSLDPSRRSSPSATSIASPFSRSSWALRDGRDRGRRLARVRSLIALALTLAVIVKIVIPLILAGCEPAWVTVAATGVTLTTFLLTEGVRARTVAAAIGTFGSLALVGGLAALFDELARFTASRGSEDISYLQAVGLNNIDIGGLHPRGDHLRGAGHPRRRDGDPGGDGRRTARARSVARASRAPPRAMNVGRSHIAATVNTLVLAYVGASLPLIVLFAAGRQDPLLTASMEVVAVEVVRAIVGSIGIVAAVPLTTAVAVALTGRYLPFVRRSSAEARRSRGWR